MEAVHIFLTVGSVASAAFAIIRLYTLDRKRAVESALWKQGIEHRLSSAEQRMTDLHSTDEDSESEQRDFRKDVYAALREIRDRLTRIEARANGK